MIAIIQAQFNSVITSRLLDGSKKELKKNKIDFEVFEVPGVLEISYKAKKLIDSKKYDAIIVLGCVIKGDTYHFEIVSNESARAITELNLLGEIPVINGVLTCFDMEQAEKRSKGVNNKGIDFAKAALSMTNYGLRITD